MTARHIAGGLFFLAASMVNPISCTRRGNASPPPPLSFSPEPRVLPNDFQRGVNFAHIHRRGSGYGSRVASLELDSLKSLGVEWVAITPFGYQGSAAADRVFGYPGAPGESEFFRRTDPSMTDDDVRAEADSIHARGMRVTLKPQLWSRDFWNGQEWSGTIRQSDAAAHERWWNSYCAFALHYARLAAAAHSDQYCIGTELARMTTAYPDEWRELIRQVRELYHGRVTYAAHWEKEFEDIAFWEDLDFIGITAYFPLDAPDDAGVEDLVQAWQPYRTKIAGLAARVHRPVLFLEAGYPAVQGGYRQPWVYRDRKPDAGAQAIAYEALFRAFASEPWWRGIYFWKDFTDPGLTYERGDRSGYGFRHRPAEKVLRAWFRYVSPHDGR